MTAPSCKVLQTDWLQKNQQTIFKEAFRGIVRAGLTAHKDFISCYRRAREATHSLSTSSMRDCQPLPVERKLTRTSRAMRMVIRSLVGGFCKPRTPNLCASDGDNESTGRKWRKSFAVSSRTSPSLSVNGLRLPISSCLPCIGLAETDHPNAINCFNKTQYMQSVIQIPSRNMTSLSVIATGILLKMRCVKRT